MALLIMAILNLDPAGIAQSFHGISYKWGGNTPEQGFDCSGLVCESMRSAGYLDNRDLTAQGLYEYYMPAGISSRICRNSLLFFGSKKSSISHVAIALDEHYMIEAGGEGRNETTKGYVRIRPIKNRTDLVAVVNMNINN